VHVELDMFGLDVELSKNHGTEIRETWTEDPRWGKRRVVDKRSPYLRINFSVFQTFVELDRGFRLRV
jgi:hypothetical protein